MDTKQSNQEKLYDLANQYTQAVVDMNIPLSERIYRQYIDEFVRQERMEKQPTNQLINN